MVTMAWSCYLPWGPCHDYTIIFDDDSSTILFWSSSYHGEYESKWSYHVIAWSSCLTVAVNSGKPLSKNCEQSMLIQIITSLIFSTIFIIWKKNHPLNANVFFTFTCQLSGRCPARSILTLKIFHHQIVANLTENATEIVRFLIYVRKLCFI